MDFSQIENLIEKDKIREIMSRYVRYADQRDWSKLASLFTMEGEFIPLDLEGKAILHLTGREQIANILSENVGHATVIHHLFSYEINMSAKTAASGVFSMEDYILYPDNGEISPTTKSGSFFRTMHGFGHYHVDFIRLGDQWNIRKLLQTRIKLDYTH